MGLTDKQRRLLYRELNGARVRKLEGKFDYLETWDVIGCLGGIFGVEGWDDDSETELIFEELVTWTKDGKERQGWDVAYRGKALLTIRDPEGHFVCTKAGEATGSATHQASRADAHDLALKTAASDALKRAAIKLGDQFGLSLYVGDGSLRSIPGTAAYETKPPQA